ncbi:MAG: molybdenum cofactor guanylyltransferase MobA [Halarcobacter sp.]
MLSTYDIPCVILCGGKSSRMGEDKALLPFSHSDSLTEYQYKRLKPYFKKIYISSKNDKFPFLKTQTNNLILDIKEESSPIVALEAILKTIKSSKVFIITVDTPLVKIESIKQLVEKSFDNNICVAQTERTHNLCGVFDKSCLSKIEDMLKNDIHKVGYLLKSMETKYLNFENEDEFINLNDKEEYARAKSIIS